MQEEVAPDKWQSWKEEQDEFWTSKPKAAVTKSFFDALVQNLGWCCINCHFPANPNWARRLQDIKEFGYTVATNTVKYCATCNKNTTHLILLPLKRGGITGYETWSKETRSRIISLLGAFDAYEGKVMKKEGLLPDHKFPEIRWDAATRRQNLDDLTDDEILNDFQLLSNQRNQQKREVCRSCYQTGNRGTMYGIPFFYEGGPTWDKNIPPSGKAAEAGCRGCAWYDINQWRESIKNKIKS